jgi:hypothetical protein
VPPCSDEERPPVCDRIREAELARDLMQVSRRIGFRFGAYIIRQSPSCYRLACSGNPAQYAAGPHHRNGRDKPVQWELPRVLPCYLARGRQRRRIWGKCACSKGWRVLSRPFARLAEAYWTAHSPIFHPGLTKSTMSNLKLIGTRRQMRRSSNRLGSPRKDGLLRDWPRRVQPIDGASASMALAGISRRCSSSFDNAQANCGCTNLWKRRALFG